MVYSRRTTRMCPEDQWRRVMSPSAELEQYLIWIWILLNLVFTGLCGSFSRYLWFSSMWFQMLFRWTENDVRCCLCFCFQGSEQESKGLPCKKGIVQSVVGQGYHRKIVLASQSTQNTIYRSVFTPTSSSSIIQPHKAAYDVADVMHVNTDSLVFLLNVFSCFSQSWNYY